MKKKKNLKKIVVLCVMLITLVVPTATVSAKTHTLSPTTVTVYPKGSKYNNIYLEGYTSANLQLHTTLNKNTKIKALTSSKPSVASLKKMDGKGFAKGTMCLFLDLKKAGTTTVAYTIGSTKTQTKIIAKKYVPPFSKLTLGKSNITSKFKNSNVYYLPYSKYANKSLKLNYKAAKGWYISAGYLHTPGHVQSDSLESNMSFKVKKKNTALEIFGVNDKGDQVVQCYVIFK